MPDLICRRGRRKRREKNQEKNRGGKPVCDAAGDDPGAIEFSARGAMPGGRTNAAAYSVGIRRGESLRPRSENGNRRKFSRISFYEEERERHLARGDRYVTASFPTNAGAVADAGKFSSRGGRSRATRAAGATRKLTGHRSFPVSRSAEEIPNFF